MRLLDMTACVHLLMELLVLCEHRDGFTMIFIFWDQQICVCLCTQYQATTPHTQTTVQQARWVYATQLWCVFNKLNV